MSVILENNGYWKRTSDYDSPLTYTVTFTIKGYETEFSCNPGQYGGNTALATRSLIVKPICGYDGTCRILWTKAQIAALKQAFEDDYETTLQKLEYWPLFSGSDGYDDYLLFWDSDPFVNPNNWEIGDEITWTFVAKPDAPLGKAKMLFIALFSIIELEVG